ncbi:MAG TPA: hypothetical protein VMU22_15205 [Rhizomicrobium sp.]|nr:hypothetical protein [Rhizomicrobium sp.]
MLESIIALKDIECPGCGAQGMTISPRGSSNSYLAGESFRQELRNGLPEIVCIHCDEPADTVLQSGYN